MISADFQNLRIRRPPLFRTIPWATVELARLDSRRTLVLCLRSGRILSLRTRRAPELLRLAECVGVRVAR